MSHRATPVIACIREEDDYMMYIYPIWKLDWLNWLLLGPLMMALLASAKPRTTADSNETPTPQLASTKP